MTIDKVYIHHRDTEARKNNVIKFFNTDLH